MPLMHLLTGILRYPEDFDGLQVEGKSSFVLIHFSPSRWNPKSL